MNKKEVFQHFSNLIDDMLDNSLFFPTYFQHPCMLEDICGSIDDDAVPENLHIRFGISRGCIIDDDYDYVVKFDTGSDEFGDSLCEREVEIFRAAQAKRLDTYFASATFLGEYRRTINFYDINKIEACMYWEDYDVKHFDDEFMKHEDKFGEIIPITIVIPLFAYERADRYTYACLSGEEELEYKEKARAIHSPLRGRHLQIAMEFVFRYGIEQYEKLSEFMYDYQINDLHYGNLGGIKGNLVIFDYAGYHSEYSDEEYDERTY